MTNDLPIPIEVIFSCSVCQATISDIYREPVSDKGLRDDADAAADAAPVTKLWLLECCHLTCSEHLEGGGKSDSIIDHSTSQLMFY